MQCDQESEPTPCCPTTRVHGQENTKQHTTIELVTTGGVVDTLHATNTNKTLLITFVGGGRVQRIGFCGQWGGALVTSRSEAVPQPLVRSPDLVSQLGRPTWLVSWATSLGPQLHQPCCKQKEESRARGGREKRSSKRWEIKNQI